MTEERSTESELPDDGCSRWVKASEVIVRTLDYLTWADNEVNDRDTIPDHIRNADAQKDTRFIHGVGNADPTPAQQESSPKELHITSSDAQNGESSPTPENSHERTHDGAGAA